MRTNENWRTTPLDDFTKDRVLYWIENTNQKELTGKYADAFKDISRFVKDQIERNKNEAVFLSDAQITVLKKGYQNQARQKAHSAKYGNSFAATTSFLDRKYNAFRG